MVEAALEVREASKAAGLQSWVKTTGSKGLHVVVPLSRKVDWETVQNFTDAIARSCDLTAAVSALAKTAHPRVRIRSPKPAVHFASEIRWLISSTRPKA